MKGIPLQVIHAAPADIRQEVDRRHASYPLARRFAGLCFLLRRWRERRRGRAALASLGDRMLRDIGITRTDAEHEINKPFWRE